MRINSPSGRLLPRAPRVTRTTTRSPVQSMGEVFRRNKNIRAAIFGRDQAIATGLYANATNCEAVVGWQAVLIVARFDQAALAHHVANQVAKFWIISIRYAKAAREFPHFERVLGLLARKSQDLIARDRHIVHGVDEG